jgi:hypothetical protein
VVETASLTKKDYRRFESCPKHQMRRCSSVGEFLPGTQETRVRFSASAPSRRSSVGQSTRPIIVRRKFDPSHRDQKFCDHSQVVRHEVSTLALREFESHWSLHVIMFAISQFLSNIHEAHSLLEIPSLSIKIPPVAAGWKSGKELPRPQSANIGV